MDPTLAVLALLTLHTLDGRTITINPTAIVSIAKPKDGEVITDDVGCVVSLVDGKFVSTRETCMEVITLIKEGEER